MRTRSDYPLSLLATLVLALASGGGVVSAEEPASATPPTPLALVDFNSSDAAKQVTATKGIPSNSVITVDKTGIALSFQPQQPTDGKHPGVHITPATGKVWDLSAYGTLRRRS